MLIFYLILGYYCIGGLYLGYIHKNTSYYKSIKTKNILHELDTSLDIDPLLNSELNSELNSNSDKDLIEMDPLIMI